MRLFVRFSNTVHESTCCLYSLPIGWRRDIVKNGDIPSRDEHVFAYEMDYDSENPDRQSFAYNKIKGVVKIREAFVTGYGIPHERYTCRTWDGRSPLQQCKFPFKVQVKQFSKSHYSKSQIFVQKVNFDRTKIGGKCQNSKIEMRHFQ